MGMTLWVHTLNARKIDSDETDHSWMHRLDEPLDAMCVRDGVEKLSTFFDYTDLEHNMVDDDDTDESDDDQTDEEPELDPETG